MARRARVDPTCAVTDSWDGLPCRDHVYRESPGAEKAARDEGVSTVADERALEPFDHVVDVVRPDDLLVLRFGFVNLAPAPDDPARLVRVRSGAGVDTFVVVGFPPQHVQERAFDESAAGKEPLAPAPIAAAADVRARLAFRLPADEARSRPRSRRCSAGTCGSRAWRPTPCRRCRRQNSSPR